MIKFQIKIDKYAVCILILIHPKPPAHKDFLYTLKYAHVWMLASSGYIIRDFLTNTN